MRGLGGELCTGCEAGAAAVEMTSFPLWVVVTRFLNLLLLSLLARSGIEVLSAFPKLYLNDHCPPGREVARFSKKTFSADSRKLWTSLDEEESWSPLVALPGRNNLGLGRHWHFLTVQFWVLTGLVYVVLLFTSGEWHRLVPDGFGIVPEAFAAVGTYLQGDLPTELPGLTYNAAQQLAYFLVVFLLAPLQIATGAAMSPAVIARFPRYTRLFGGRQAARTLHFIGLCACGVRLRPHPDGRNPRAGRRVSIDRARLFRGRPRAGGGDRSGGTDRGGRCERRGHALLPLATSEGSGADGNAHRSGRAGAGRSLEIAPAVPARGHLTVLPRQWLSAPRR